MKDENLKRMAQIGLALMVLSFIFAIAETLYFGGNRFPESKAEATCDAIAIFACGYGSCLFTLAMGLKTVNNIKQVLNDHHS